jgi:hypothetical protein
MHKNILITFLSILLLVNLSCVNKSISKIPPPPPPPPPPPSPSDTLSFNKYREDQRCRNTNKFTAKERRLIYPFNGAESIKIVSFSPVLVYYSDTSYIEAGGIPQRKGIIDFSKFSETIILSDSQIDSLTNIIYNYQTNLDYYLISHLACDCPCQNAILFMNKKDKCFAYIGLCFKDQDYFSYPENTEVGDFCEGKYELLKNFFRNAGIREGLE